MLADGAVVTNAAMCVQLRPSSDKLSAARARARARDRKEAHMPIHRSNAPATKADAGTMNLLCIVATVLGCQVLGCASAKVGVGPGPDGGTSDTGSVANGKDTSGPNGKNDGATSYGPCDPFSNAGCTSGEKCSTLRNDQTLAVGCGSKGSKSEGDLCTPIPTSGPQTGDDCGDGLACFSVLGQSPVCHRICATGGNTDTCPGTETCSLDVGGLAGLEFCQATTPCQPLEQTGCPSSDQACYYGTKGAVCAGAGSVQPGGTCVNANDCARGSTCLTVGATGFCSSFCSTASGGTPSCSGANTGGTLCSVLGGPSDEANLGSCRQQP